MSSTFFIPAVNMMGLGSLDEAMQAIARYNLRKALIVTDAGLARAGVAERVAGLLAEQRIDAVIFDGAQPNPTIGNVQKGLALLRQSQCDFIISLGGGSPHDCAKGIALCATNGGEIADYEGVDRSSKPQLPLVAINTTAGTASEMTRFCIITDESRHVKMAIVDRNVTPLLSVNDPALMAAMPKGLTAATGMDALTHAVEAYVSIAATPITDACALKAIELIARHLRQAVAQGDDLQAREQMAYAQFLAGMAFNNASLGYVHAMAHQLGGFYDLPHGECNAILLPHVERANMNAKLERFVDMAKFLGENVEGMSIRAAAEKALDAIKQLSTDVGIPSGLIELGKRYGKNVRKEDIAIMTGNAQKDACGFTNPVCLKDADVARIYEAAL